VEQLLREEHATQRRERIGEVGTLRKKSEEAVEVLQIEATDEGRLALLVQTIRTRDAPGTRTWNATMQGRIFADTEEKN
jgi:hypothetical protein